MPPINTEKNALGLLAQTTGSPFGSKSLLCSQPQAYAKRVEQDIEKLKPFLIKYINLVAKHSRDIRHLHSENPTSALLHHGICEEATAILRILLESKGHDVDHFLNMALQHYVLVSNANEGRVIVDPTYLQWFPVVVSYPYPAVLIRELDDLFFSYDILVLEEGKAKQAASLLVQSGFPDPKKILEIFEKYAIPELGKDAQEKLLSQRYLFRSLGHAELWQRLADLYDLDFYAQSANQLYQYLRLGKEGKFEYSPPYTKLLVAEMQKDGFLNKGYAKP